MRRISFDFSENYIAAPEIDNTSRTARERLHKIVRLIILNDLTPRQRQLCEMYFDQSMTQTEIAAKLGINRSTVCRTLARGVHRLSERVKYYKIR